MMSPRYFFIALALIFTICSCNSNSNKQPGGGSETAAAGENDETPAGSEDQGKTGSNGFWEKLEMRELRDQNGMVAAIMPLPSSWKLGGGSTLSGPNGIRVTDYPAKNFMINYNQSLQYAYQSGGQQMRAMPGIEQLIQEDFVPVAANSGLEFVRYYEIPEISKMDKWYSDQLYKAMPSRSDVLAYGTEWKTKEGNPYFLLIHLNVSTSEAMQTWYYMSSGLEADPEHFEKAKKQYIFALANTRYNLQPIMVYNEQEAQRVGRSWAAHNQRMIQNQANFEAQQRAFVNKSNAINDAIMSGWRERNAASDKQQEQRIDNIYERTNVVDPTTGQGYKVSAGANNYWMNSNGEYIGTQLQGYDPNLDKNMNEIKWQELKLRKQ